MNFNFKNLSENTKRIRIIPKNGAELFANIGVDNPTAMIDEDGVFSVCLSPNETPTISCDGAVEYVDFALLLRDGTDPSILEDTDLLLILDGEIPPPMTPPPDWLEMGEGAPFPQGIPNGFSVLETIRLNNIGNQSRRTEIKSLSEDVQVIAYSNPTSVQLSSDNSHTGACLSEATPETSCDGATPSAVLKGYNVIGMNPPPTVDIYVQNTLIAENVDATFINQNWYSNQALIENKNLLNYHVYGTSSNTEAFEYYYGSDYITFRFVPKTDGFYNGQVYSAKDALQIDNSNYNSTAYKDPATGELSFCIGGAT